MDQAEALMMDFLKEREEIDGILATDLETDWRQADEYPDYEEIDHQQDMEDMNLQWVERSSIDQLI